MSKRIPSMSEHARALIQTHWDLANSPDWRAFAELRDPSLLYEVAQTQEDIEGDHGYLEMFSTWPGAWSAAMTHLVCEESKAVSVIDFVVGAERVTGISIFHVANGRITGVTDDWPSVKRRPASSPPMLLAARRCA
jgi:hypothetical protein